MKVVRNKSGEYPDCGYAYLDFERFNEDDGETALFYGYASGRDKGLIEQHKSYKRKIFYQGEQPCGFYSLDTAERIGSVNIAHDFDEFYSTCPYSAKWMNEIHGFDKYRPAIFPHNKRWAVPPNEKSEKNMDVIYWGNLPNNSIDIKTIIDIIPKFKYSFYSLGYGLTQDMLRKVTAFSAPRTEMWRILSNTKVMVTSNQLYLNDAEIQVTKKLPRWEENEAFSHLEQKVMPQIKTRPIEAIFNKTLVLLKEDPWRIFDYWFEPGVDFLYYKNNDELEEMLREITTNWDNYKHIAESAYNKAMSQYTAEKLYRDMEKGQSEFKFKH